MPSALPALVCLSDPSASKLEIWIENLSDTSVKYASTILVPTADGTMAFAINPSLLPIALSPWTGEYPKSSATTENDCLRYAGAIVTACIARPYTALGALEVSSCPITALHPAVKSASSWDFTRCHLYAFSRAGIFTIAFGPAKNNPASALIDPRGVSEGSRTAYTSSGVMAVADTGQLLQVSGARTTMVLDHADADTLEWFIPANQLRLHHSGATTALSLQNMERHAIQATDASGLIPVKWTARMALPSRRRPKSIRLAMAATNFTGTMLLAGDSGKGCRPLLTLSVKGRINAPLTAFVIAHPCSFLTISVSGVASPDFIITDARATLTST